MFKEILKNVREKSPLIHNITNYVTVNDCANILLACGASPIMSDDPQEVEEITSICDGLNINIGTLNSHTIPSMFSAGKKANQLGHPVLLDPVGAGASSLRTDTAKALLENVKFAVIRGNISEIKALCQNTASTKGVDANSDDAVKKDNLEEAVCFAKAFAKQTGSVIAITGETDIVTDGSRAYCIFNGNPMMSKITGTGCQLSAMTTAYVAANPQNTLEAVAAAVCAMGVCGEAGLLQMSQTDGNISYRGYIIDAIYNLTGDILEEKSRFIIK